MSQCTRVTDRRTEFSSLDRVCIPCSAVKSKQLEPMNFKHKSVTTVFFGFGWLVTTPAASQQHKKIFFLATSTLLQVPVPVPVPSTTRLVTLQLRASGRANVCVVYCSADSPVSDAADVLTNQSADTRERGYIGHELLYTLLLLSRTP